MATLGLMMYDVHADQEGASSTASLCRSWIHINTFCFRYNSATITCVDRDALAFGAFHASGYNLILYPLHMSLLALVLTMKPIKHQNIRA